jgi:hypothetical protein
MVQRRSVLLVLLLGKILLIVIRIISQNPTKNQVILYTSMNRIFVYQRWLIIESFTLKLVPIPLSFEIFNYLQLLELSALVPAAHLG